MISIDKAKILKELGLKWEPKRGDYYLYESLANKETCVDLIMQDNPGFWCDAVRTWLPRLDQLLNEIEKLGYHPRIEKWEDEFYECNPCLLGIYSKGYGKMNKTWEDAVADVLIGLLEKENKL